MNRKHLPVLDGIRGLAIIAVLLRHVAYVFKPHGSISRWILPIPQFGSWGVDLFFVLSGFLITGILIETKGATNRATSFYGRRVLRIFPLYYLILAIMFVGAYFSQWISEAGNLHGAMDHLAYLFYLQNFYPLWHNGAFGLAALGPFWSVAVEEQFYLIWPALVWKMSPRSILKISGIGLATTLVLRLILVPKFGAGIWVFAATPTRADGLFVGAALAAILAIKGKFEKSLIIGLAAVGALLVVAVPIFKPARELWETGALMAVIGITGIALCSGALIAYCLTYSESRLARVFQAKWLRNFGKYSYGIYLIHATIYHAGETFLTARGIDWPYRAPLGFVYAITVMGVSYGLAWLSFHYFESRFLALKHYYEPVFQTVKRDKLRQVELVGH
jgi:peptidoglycan/LPS O-acetylase OafA/YrhL